MAKVLHIITDLDPGGAEKFLLRLASALEENTLSSTVLYLTGQGRLEPQFQAAGIETYAIEMRWSFRIVPSLWRLLRHAFSLRPDVIQTWMYHADLLGGVIGVLLNVPVIWSVRQSNLSPSVNKRRTLMIVRLCAFLSGWLPRYIVYNSVAAARAHARKGYAKGKEVIIHNGIDCTKFKFNDQSRQRIRRELGVGREAVVVGHVARFDKQKDHLTYLKAVKLLHEASPSTCFILAGEGVTWDNRELTQDFDPIRDSSWLFLLGHRADIGDIFSAMDIFCLSSCGESFPNVVIEAMAIGLPCLGTDVGDVREMIADTGRVVASRNHLQLVDACKELLALPTGVRQEIGRRAALRVKANYSLSHAAEQFFCIYERCQSSRARTS